VIFLTDKKSVKIPIAIGISAVIAHKAAGAVEFRSAINIERPKPTIKAEIPYANALFIGRSRAT
jgi:hypothetical protein